MAHAKYQPRATDAAVNVERLKAERPVPVDLTDDAYNWYASGNDDMTTWSGQVAPDWAAGARTLYAMAGWAYGLGLRYEGDPDKVRQWTGRAPNSTNGADLRLGGLYAKYANCRRWWSSWQSEHMDGTPKDSMVLLDTKSCHDPLCPLCMRLKTHKRQIAYGRAWEELQKRKESKDGTPYKLLQIVVDIGRNCTGDELRGQLDRLIKGTQRFVRWLDETKHVVAHAPDYWVWGDNDSHRNHNSALWMLGTEITRHHAMDALHGTYHPHCHLIVAVYSSQIQSKLQGGNWSTCWRKSAGISRPEMIRKWRDIMGDPTINNLYMGKVDNPHQALKYAVKGSIGKVDDNTGDAALYVAGDDWDSYNMDTLSTIHDAIVEYRHGQRNRSRQMFRASLAWAHLATLKAAELKIALDDTDADDTVQSDVPGRIVRGRQRRGKIEAVSVDPDLTTLTEARQQIRLEQSLRYNRR